MSLVEDSRLFRIIGPWNAKLMRKIYILFKRFAHKWQYKHNSANVPSIIADILQIFSREILNYRNFFATEWLISFLIFARLDWLVDTRITAFEFWLDIVHRS